MENNKYLHTPWGTFSVGDEIITVWNQKGKIVSFGPVPCQIQVDFPNQKNNTVISLWHLREKVIEKIVRP